MAIRIVKHAFEIVGLMTARNPVDVFVSAIMNGGAREDYDVSSELGYLA